MMEFENVSKCFEKVKAVNNVTVKIEEGRVFGLIGTNGSGKSTLMRLTCGVYRPDEGSIRVDGEPIYDNPSAKAKIFYVSDDQYFFTSGTPLDMLKFYTAYIPGFDREKWRELMEVFGLDVERKINTFSKGMKKQLSMICGISANTKYLLCDETFDGLDPFMRHAVKAVFAKEIEDRGLTPVIVSHNLRELEDICECVALFHRGGILMEQDLDEMKLSIHKVQCVIKEKNMLQELNSSLEVLKTDARGNLYTFIVRGKREDLVQRMEQLNPAFYELMPLSLEEIFISEMEVKGYDIKALIL